MGKLALLLGAACLALASAQMPLPWTSEVRTGDSGHGVVIMKNLLARHFLPGPPPFSLNGTFGQPTKNGLMKFQKDKGLEASGVLDSPSANVLLADYAMDNYRDSGDVPDPYKYKVVITFYRDRNIETSAVLYDKQMKPMALLQVRSHGQNISAGPGPARNQFTSNGATPTGLSTFDLNSPESNHVAYGPYPINRFVKGLEGNAKFLISEIRTGILLHTGEWPGWNPNAIPPQPMPDSHGCVHSHPDQIKMVWKMLVEHCGVVVHQNPFSSRHYPYQPQGLVSIVEMD